jgi:hypothetical protein
MEAKSSFVRTRAAASRATSVPRPPIAMPMVAALSAGGVVHAVARHRHDVSPRHESANDPELLLGHHAGEDRRRPDTRDELVVPERVELRSGQRLPCPEARGVRDGASGLGVVAGDHDDMDPGGAALGDGFGHARADRIFEPDEAEPLEHEVVLTFRELGPRDLGARHAEDAHALLGELAHLLQDRLDSRPVEVAQIDHRLGRSLGGDEELPTVTVRVGHGEQLGRERVRPPRNPCIMQVLGARERLAPDGVERELHRVEWVLGAREDAVLDEGVDLLRELARRAVDEDPMLARDERRDPHLVLGEGPGLVREQRGRGAERFDRGHSPREDVALGDAVRAERLEHREDDRQLFGEQRHRQGEPREQPLRPRPPRGAEDHDHEPAQHDGHDGHHTDRTIDLLLELGPRGRDLAERAADLAHSRAGAGATHDHPCLPRDDEGARVDLRTIVASGLRRLGVELVFARGALAHRDGLARQEGLVDGDMLAVEEHAVRGDAVPFAEHDHVPPAPPLAPGYEGALRHAPRAPEGSRDRGAPRPHARCDAPARG